MQWHNYGYQRPAAETSAPYHLDTPLSFVSQHPCVLYEGHGHGKQSSDQFIASAERRDNYPAHNRPFLGGRYSLFSEVKKFLSRDREKRSRLETIESR